tara:strand:+ start:238 stop:432 length:195 start_codon:yes stop_codon:yes gene_type:complete
MNQAEKFEAWQTFCEIIDHYDFIKSYLDHAKYNKQDARIMVKRAIIELEQISDQLEYLEKFEER